MDLVAKFTRHGDGRIQMPLCASCCNHDVHSVMTLRFRAPRDPPPSLPTMATCRSREIFKQNPNAEQIGYQRRAAVTDEGGKRQPRWVNGPVTTPALTSACMPINIVMPIARCSPNAFPARPAI